VPVWLYLFDLLYVDGYDIRRVPLRYRKQVLRHAFHVHDSLRFTEHRDTEGEAYYREACRRGWEGVIAKDGESVYVSADARLAAPKGRSSSSAARRILAAAGSVLAPGWSEFTSEEGWCMRAR
jgi:hypothetical protein